MDDKTRTEIKGKVAEIVAAAVDDPGGGWLDSAGLDIDERKARYVATVMAAIDEATAPQWTAVTLDTTPPDGTVVLGWWGYDYEVCATWRIRGTWYTQARGATTFPPSHYMPLPPAPLDA